jgi:hypothetical protein
VIYRKLKKKYAMKKHCFCIIIFVIFAFPLFLTSLTAQDISNRHKLTLIDEFKTFDDLLVQHKELAEKKTPILIGEEYVYFYSDEAEKLFNKIKIKITHFKSEDIAEFNNANRKRNVSKKEYIYKIIDNVSLWASEFDVEYTSESNVIRSNRLSSELYNAKGEQIAEFGSLINAIKFSSDGKYFVATRTGINPNDTLFFFNNLGQIINYQKTDRPNFEFSQNNKYVKVFNADGQFWLYSNTGNLLLHIDIREKFHQGYIGKCFVLDSLNYILFSTFVPSEKNFLVDLDGNILWEKPSKLINNCFYLNKNALLLYTIDEKDKYLDESRKSIIICSIEGGSILDEIIDCHLIRVNNNRFIVEKGGAYYEYEVN